MLAILRELQPYLTTNIPYSLPQSAQPPACQQAVDVAQRGVCRAFADGGPFGVGQFALRAVQRAVKYVSQYPAMPSRSYDLFWWVMSHCRPEAVSLYF